MAARLSNLLSSEFLFFNRVLETTTFINQKGKPALSKFWYYARVEMRPPNVADINIAVAESYKLMDAAKAGAWRQIKFKASSLIYLFFPQEGFLNAVVTLEVLCWFFVGEIIGRRSLIGYSRVPGGFMKAH